MSKPDRPQPATTIASTVLMFLWSPLVSAEPSVDQTINIIIQVLVYGLIAAVAVHVSIRQRRAGKPWKRVALTVVAGAAVAFLIIPLLALTFILIHGRTM